MGRAFKDTPWPVILLVASFLCPTELSIYIGPARLPPHRALLLVLLPVALFGLFGRRGIRFKLFDIAILGFSIWTLGIYIHHHGQADGLQTGGALALDSFASFIVARAFVRDARAFAGTATVLFAAVAVTGLLALPESLSGQILVHDFLREVTGYAHPVGVEKRLGLTRAYGTFDHPIHLGTFCASSLALVVYSMRRRSGAGLRALVIGASAMLGFSSAPMLSLGAQSALMGLDRLTRGVPGRVAMGLGAIATLFVAAAVVGTRSPFALIATGLTIDSWTGYYRLMIWEHGLANVWSNPWTGIGLNDWERPAWMVSSTVDAFWLVIVMRSGLPAFLLLALAIVLLGRGIVVQMRRADPDIRRMATGWMISLTALSLVACTVHFWNVPYAYFFFFLGLGGCLGDPLRQRQGAVAKTRQQAAPQRVVWVRPEAAPRPGPVEGWSTGPAAWPIPVPRLPAR